MGKLWMLFYANIRKSIGQTISFAIIIIIAAIMLNLGLITLLNFEKSFEEKWDNYNYGDTFMIMKKEEYKDSFLEYAENLNGIKEAEQRNGLLVDGSIDYNNSNMNILHLFYNMDEEHSLSRISLIEEINYSVEKPIYLSYLMKTGGGYNLGDSFTVTTANANYRFTVAGFVEDLNLGTYNLGILGGYLKDKEFNDFSKELGATDEVVTLTCKLVDKKQDKKIYSIMGHYFVNEGISFLSGNYFTIAKMARTITASIGSMIIVAFALIIVVVSLVVIHFRIVNAIEEEMKNMGVLKSLGYTSKQIISSVLLQYIGVSLVGVVVGVCGSYGLLPILKFAFDAQTGIRWEQGFDTVSATLTTVIILSLVGIVAYSSSHRIKQMQPIIALRSGITTHNFKNNYLPLDKSIGNIHFLLSLKKIIQNAKQNIMLIMVMIAIMFASLFAGVIYYNIGVDNKIFVNAVTSEIADVSFSFKNDIDYLEMIENVKKLDGVEKALYYDFRPAMYQNENLTIYITEDFSILENNKCFEGRDPVHDNEIALGGGAAKAYHKKIGDTINLEFGNQEEEYLITGLIQSANSGGFDAELTTNAYKKLMPQFKPDLLYVYLEEGMNNDRFIDTVKETYKEYILSSSNLEETVKSQMGIYSVIVSILAMIIIGITAALVTLILYLLIKTIIIRRKQEFGIMKAIGYTTLHLMFQLALSFMPVIMVGTILGGILGVLGINPMLSFLFRGIGIMKINFVISMPIILGIGIGLCVFAFVICMLVSAKIRKITTYTLITE